MIRNNSGTNEAFAKSSYLRSFYVNLRILRCQAVHYFFHFVTLNEKVAMVFHKV